MAPDDARHGTYAGYVAESFARVGHCEPCRVAHRAYKKQRRTRQYFTGGSLMLDPTGTRRRIEALIALGWSFNELDRRLGRSPGLTSRQRAEAAGGRPVFQSTAATYAALYDRLSMRLPPDDRFSRRARARAATLGWVVPLGWDEESIDDPKARPLGVLGHHARRRDEVDEAVILRVLAGEDLVTTRAEKEEILARHVEAGGSERELCTRLGWKEGRYTRRQGVAA